MSTNRNSLLPFRVVAILVVLAMFLAPIAGLIPGAYATETITIVPTQAVYLVNNGDTANVGFKMTYTGTPDTGTGLDRDITLVITTGTSLQVGGAPGNAQNVATTLAGGIATIAGGNTTLVAGNTTLAAASAAGVSNIKMTSVSNFAVGQTVNIDTGANLESATIAIVGAGGSTTLGWPAAIGDTNIKVPNIASFVAGRTIYIDTGANLESAVVAVVGTAGATGVRTATAIGATSIPVTSTTGFVVSNTITIDTGANAETAVILSTTGGGSPSITVATPLANAHAVGAMVAGSGITLAAPLALAHASGAAVTGNGLTLAAPLTLAHASGVALVTVAPIGTSKIRVNSVNNFAAGQTVNIDTGANLESATIATVGTGGSTTLGWPAAIGDDNIKVPAVTGFVTGTTIYIDNLPNLESAVVAAVGSAGATTVRTATAAGATNIPVVSSTGFAAGNTITIDTGANAETAVILSTTGGGSPSITVVAPLANAHAVGAMVAGSGITLAAPLALAHASGAAVTGNGLTLASPLTLAHAGAAAVTTLTPAGATNIKVTSVTGFVVSQTINIDTGANLETATIANVGTSGATGTGLDLTAGLILSHTGAPAVVQTDPSAVAGATNVKVNSVMGYYPGDTINIDSGANIERRTILAVGTAGVSGTGIDLDTPLTLPHAAGVSATDTRILPSTAVLGTDYTVVSNTVIIPAGSISGTIVTIPIATLPNPNPSVALTINTITGCTAGCTGVTVNNNDPSTVVINAHGFPYLNSALPVATRVADLMSRMSLFDKVGQMAQTNMTVLTNGTTTNESSYNGVRAWRLGSILSGGTDSPTPNSPTGWADLVDSFEYRAMATPLQIPLIYGIDTIHGNSHMIGSVLFPHDIGMGATRNPELSYQQGVITAQETRSTGPQWGFGPTICVDRDIRWGRTYECYSEDPDLVNLMEPIIEGYQGSDPLDMSGVHIVASAKHFAGDGATQNGTNTGVDVMSSEEFARVALAPYIPAVQTYHAGTIMPSYSSVQLDGATTSIKMSANADLMTGWLKQQTGFDGFLISDYNAIDQIPVPSPNPLPAPINNSYAYQAMISFNAGMDMVMAPNNPAWKNFINYVQTLVKTGYMEQSRIDDAVRRILMQKFALGLFEQPFTDRSTQDQILSAEHRAVVREATAQSQVLLKNVDNILPLSKTAKVYLAGSNAHSVINQAGGWSISWQSIPTGDVAAVDTYFTTIREAIQNVVGTGNITYSLTASPAPVTGTYDVGIVVVGEVAYAEGSGDVPTSKTNATTTADATAIDNVCNVMPCIIMTVSGRPFWLTDAQFNTAEAVVASWIGSSEGDGMADVLFGDHDFTGRLPMTWSRSVAQEPINVGDATYDPRYPYGWGLRIGTTFSTKSSLQAARDSLATISGDTHVTAAVAALDSLLAANVWNPDGSVSDPGATLRALQVAANELAATSVESITQDDGVVSAARDIAQANVVRNGGPDATSSPLIADAEHELMISHPDVAVTLLTLAAGDVLPPTTSASLEPSPVNGWYTTTPTVTLTAVDAESGVARTDYRIDSGLWQTYTIPFQVTGDGQHLVDFFSVDLVGNVESTQSITFELDALGPSVVITPDRAPNSAGWYTSTVTFTATGMSEAGLSVICDAPRVYSGPDSAATSVEMMCTDTVGITRTATANFKYDATAPTLAPSVSPNPVLFNNPATASANAADVTSGINVTATTCSAPVVTTLGTKTVSCTATDNAGNRSALGVAVYTVVYPFTGVSPEIVHTGTGPTGYEVTFRYYDPTATKVYLRGEWYFSTAASTTLTSSQGLLPSQWVPGAFPIAYPNNGASANWPIVTMTLDSATGIWSYTTPLPPGVYTYNFYRNCPNAYPSLSGCTGVYDPANLPWNISGSVEPTSQVYVPTDSAFGGEDYSWQGPNPVHGTLYDVTYPSPQSTNPVGYHYLAVYLPPNYNPSRSVPYPTLYLSHGGAGNEVDWSTQGAASDIIDNLIASGQAQPMVVVMTNFNGIPGGTDGYRTDVISNVIPYVESHYNVSHNANDRAFAGLSAGAQRANNILFNATTTFGYVGSWSIGSSGSPAITSTLWMNPDLKTRLGIHIGGGRFDRLTVPSIDAYETTFITNSIPFVDDRIDGGHAWYVWRILLRDFAKTMAFKHTTTSIVADSNPTWVGNSVTFTATVTEDTNQPAAPSGTVTFYRGAVLDDDHKLGSTTLDSSGHATLTVSNLSTGAYDVTAVYSGDDLYSTSNADLSHLVIDHQVFLPLVVK